MASLMQQIVDGEDIGFARPLRLGFAFLLLTGLCLAQKTDLTQLSIEDLVDIQVTSASKKAENLFGAPAAIAVLTGDDIRRGGFTTLPEALRMVPGLYVARTNSHIWQISARGFSDINNNKLLVLVDGRSVYTPVYGGVFWDVLDVPLEDIDRVEVIRGPGGTLWGANAVNGVINIVTKRSKRTQGAMVSTSADLEEGYTTTVRYGGRFGSNLSYSMFGKASYWQPFASTSGGPFPDGFVLPQGGARLDWVASDKDTVGIEGGAYDGRFRSPQYFTAVPTTFLVKGSHVLVDWRHTISPRSNTQTMAYCDWYARFGAPSDARNTCDLEFQHAYAFKRHSLIWGGSFLSTGDDLSADPVPFAPERLRTNVGSGFAQYEVAAIPERLRILAGAKLEHNGRSGFEYQPQIRAVWTPNKFHALWTSVSRAVRIPARVEGDIQLTIPTGVINGEPAFLHVIGNPNLKSEHLSAYEAGYRFQSGQVISFDLAIYYNRYNNLIVSPPALPQFFPTVIFFESQYINHGSAQTHGAELSAKWRPVRRWTISAGLTETRGSADALQATPEHLFNVQSRVDLPHQVELDSTVYHYSSIPVGNLISSLPLQGVPAFNRVDVGIAWHPSRRWTFAIWGRNLQSDRHVETRNTILGDAAGGVPRSVSIKLLWQSTPEKGGSK